MKALTIEDTFIDMCQRQFELDEIKREKNERKRQKKREEMIQTIISGITVICILLASGLIV